MGCLYIPCTISSNVLCKLTKNNPYIKILLEYEKIVIITHKLLISKYEEIVIITNKLLIAKCLNSFFHQ